MTKALLCLLLVALAVAQQPVANCKVCSRAKQCDSFLFADPNIDPIYNSISSQLAITADPTSISRSQDGTKAYYTFVWTPRSFLATVDLTTRAFTVVQNTPTPTASVMSSQSSMGARSGPLVTSQSELAARIDADIRRKYGLGQDVKCLSLEAIKDGYNVVYQKVDGTVLSIDAFVQSNNGNISINYQLCPQNPSGNVLQTTAKQLYLSTVTQPYLVNQNSPNSQLFVSVAPSTIISSPSPSPAPAPAPTVGGYQAVDSKSQDVASVMSYLASQIGSIFNLCSLVNVERQTVNGFNYRLTFSVESSSPARYVVVVYKSSSGSFSVTSVNLVNVQETYSFGNQLSSNQVAALPYLKDLITVLSAQLPSLLTAGTLIDAIYKTFPYFQLVFHNKVYQQITLVVLYDIIKKTATVITQNAVPVPSEPAPAPVPAPTPAPAPVKPSNSPSQAPTVVPLQPIAGGYGLISDPLNNQGVLNVLSFLIGNLGEVIKSAVLVSAERQVVSGYNYRITLSLDSSSSAQFVIVVYQNLQESYSLTSVSLVNVKSTYSFTKALTSQEVNALSYYTLLIDVLFNQLPSLATTGATVDAVFKDFPYFQLQLHNNAQQQITLIVLFDVLNKKVNIIKQTVTPPTQPTPAPVPTPAPAPFEGYQLIGSGVRPSYLLDYISILGLSDSRCSKSTLQGIYWKLSDRGSIKYVFQIADGSKEINVSTDSIQYALAHRTSKHPKIPNCLAQQGPSCTRCAFKYYVSRGQCVPVQDECSDFDYDRNVCEGCYSGYYLDLSGVCRKTDYLCQTSDRKGNCLTCFNNYRLSVKGRCVYKADGACSDYPQQEDNPLCASFNKLTCLACVKGCYMNTAGACRIPDPNCSTFDEKNEVCLLCMSDYRLSDITKTCVPVARQY